MDGIKKTVLVLRTGLSMLDSLVPRLKTLSSEFIRTIIDTPPIYLAYFQPEVERAGFTLRSEENYAMQFFKVEKP